MRDGRCAGDWQHDGRMRQEPGDRHLIDAGVLLLCHPLDGAVLQRSSAADWRPRHKTNPLLLTILQRGLPSAMLDIVLVLHGRDWDNLTSALDLLWADLRQS